MNQRYARNQFTLFIESFITVLMVHQHEVAIREKKNKSHTLVAKDYSIATVLVNGFRTINGNVKSQIYYATQTATRA